MEEHEYIRARNATIRAFAARFPGMPDGFTRSSYDGDFPVQQVADAVHIIMMTTDDGEVVSPRYQDHEAAWAKLFESFSAVWKELHK